MIQFKPLTHTQDAEYVLVSEISDMAKIEARGANRYTGGHWNNVFMLELIVKNGQLQIKGSEHNSLLLSDIDDGDVVELGEATYVLTNLIIEHMTVVREVEVSESMWNHSKVPLFDMEKMPFVIFLEVEGICLVNIKTCAVQVLVKTHENSKGSGFCLELKDGSFDFHFTHIVEDENNI